MGANMIPIEKKRGSTVFGVRMGLLAGCQRSIAVKCPSPPQMLLTAMPSIVVVGTRYL